MGLIDEIREGFASLTTNKIRPIKALPDDYPAYVIRLLEGYGVAIKVEGSMLVSERFNSCHLHTDMIGGDQYLGNYLILSSAFEEYRYEFASLCAEFVEPGENGANRNLILSDPYKWWEGWKKLVGNADRDKRVYSVIAEMMAMDYKLKTDQTAVWAANHSGSHDIECADESGEVKSTIKRYGYEVEIAGQHQLEYKNRLYLYFCRLEESLEGESINTMKQILIQDGYDEGKLEMELEAQGFEKGSSIRNKKYKALEKRRYLVDENFPKITKESFKNNKYPDGITQIGYTINLQVITQYEIW